MCHCGDQSQDWIVSGETKKSLLKIKHQTKTKTFVSRLRLKAKAFLLETHKAKQKVNSI